MTKNTWNQAKEENGQTQFRRTSLLFLLCVICLRSLVTEASKDFLRYISRSTELCTCLLYLKEFFSSFGINCCPLFFRFLVDISQFVFHFLSILCLLCIEFFLLYKRVVKCLLIKWFYRWKIRSFIRLKIWVSNTKIFKLIYHNIKFEFVSCI